MSAVESTPDTPEFHGDLALAAFSDRGPWQVSLDEARWLKRVPTIRSTVQRQIPDLIRPKKVPAGGRLVEVTRRLGTAVGLWYALGRRKGQTEDFDASRADLSLRSVSYTHLTLPTICSV